MKKAVKLQLQFLKKEKKAKDTYSFYFVRAQNNFDFKPGQYLRINLDIGNPDERGSSRYFTISSSPTDQEFLTITTRIIRSSFKLKLNSLKSGDMVRAFGPLGYFNLDIKSRRPKIFLAGGMGVTPYHSIIRYLDKKKISVEVTLIASFSIKKEAVFYDELKKIESQNPAVRVIYTLTKDNNLYPKFVNGRIDEKMIKKYVQDYKRGDFFIVGPQTFETAMLELVKGIGISEENIFTENFPGY
ncbi:MAG: FAD-dependent oxidoreductase [Candidatus Levybacteria bacterium]|nr:FAD-dependent oxidoreductase [Candidatus Levybacteria bacterium]